MATYLFFTACHQCDRRGVEATSQHACLDRIRGLSPDHSQLRRHTANGGHDRLFCAFHRHARDPREIRGFAELHDRMDVRVERSDWNSYRVGHRTSVSRSETKSDGGCPGIALDPFASASGDVDGAGDDPAGDPRSPRVRSGTAPTVGTVADPGKGCEATSAVGRYGLVAEGRKTGPLGTGDLCRTRQHRKMG